MTSCTPATAVSCTIAPPTTLASGSLRSSSLISLLTAEPPVLHSREPATSRRTFPTLYRSSAAVFFDSDEHELA